MFLRKAKKVVFVKKLKSMELGAVLVDEWSMRPRVDGIPGIAPLHLQTLDPKTKSSPNPESSPLKIATNPNPTCFYTKCPKLCWTRHSAGCLQFKSKWVWLREDEHSVIFFGLWSNGLRDQDEAIRRPEGPEGLFRPIIDRVDPGYRKQGWRCVDPIKKQRLSNTPRVSYLPIAILSN